MIRQSRLCLYAFFVIALFSSAHAQTPPPSRNPPAKKTTPDKNKAAQDEAKRLEEQRRATAIALLISVADEARSYRNQTLRARIQARAADVLWDTDTEKARSLFRRAWEAADVADTDNQRRLDEERRAQEQAGKPFSVVAPPSLRTEVLRMAARRDRKLGEELLTKLDEARKQDAVNASTQQNNSSIETDPFELPSALKLRLRLAQQLLDTDVARAIEFADPALGRVSIDGLVFLCYLRAKNPAAADERYGAMLVLAGADAASDANSVSLLSSYIFTPFVFVRISPDGGTNQTQYNLAARIPDPVPELRAAFFRVAEQIFLRALPPPEQDHTTSGRIGKYLIMSRLLPYFEQFASEQTTTLMKAQLIALSREIPDEYRQRGWTTAASHSPDSDESDGDSIQSILGRIEHAANQEQRDNLYAQVALMASEKGDPRAVDFADKIENGDMRKSVRAYVDFLATRNAIEKKLTDEALKLARTGSLTSMQRVWALTQIAHSLVNSDREKAIELLDEAATEARRIGGTSADRARALVGVATTLYEASRAPAWEMMSEVIRSSNNAAEEFSGEDGHIVASIQTKAQTSMLSFTVEEFDLPDIFRSFAKEDLQRAILLAKDFNGESPRATALIAIVRATLEKKKASGVKK